MGRHIGPKGKVNRALGVPIYEESGATKALERRPDQPPGMRRTRRRISLFGMALVEQQKVKHYYGLRESQLRRLMDVAARQQGNTGMNLLLLCERRLDNVVRRAGFTHTHPQARQGIVHGHFLVNGRKLDKPSYLIRAGDVIEVNGQDRIRDFYRSMVDELKPQDLSWLHVTFTELRINVLSLPNEEDISLQVEIHRLVEMNR
jgi:small subunit ribosomal protein S4